MARLRALACGLLWLPLPCLAFGPDRDAQAKAASPAPTVTLPWSTVDGGGGPLPSGTRQLDASIGQADANPGEALRNGSLELRPGYWTPANDARPASLFADGFEPE